MTLPHVVLSNGISVWKMLNSQYYLRKCNELSIGLYVYGLYVYSICWGRDRPFLFDRTASVERSPTKKYVSYLEVLNSMDSKSCKREITVRMKATMARMGAARRLKTMTFILFLLVGLRIVNFCLLGARA